MTNTQANFNNSFSTNQQHVDDARQRAGIADAAAQLADLGPEVLAIQQALLAGIARSQQREAKRLAESHANDDPRILQAQARAEQVKALHEEARRQGTVLNRMIETVQDDNLFHGYIHDCNGPAAADFKVKLEFGGPDGEILPWGEASSDATGYFRIDLRSSKQGSNAASSSVKPSWIDNLSHLLAADLDGETPATPTHPFAAGSDQQTTDDARPRTRVQVFSSGGQLVLEDPMPPTFLASASEFRYYVVNPRDSATKGGGDTRA
jgi:hypothetical protein